MQKKSLWVIVLFVLLLAGCGSTPSAERTAEEMARRLPQVRTVMGKVQIQVGADLLNNELWIQRPDFLRTETESGPPEYRDMIVVLNETEAWYYVPALDVTMIADRRTFEPEVGVLTGSNLLEAVPEEVQAALARADAFNYVGREEMAGRNVHHMEVSLSDPVGIFSAGVLVLWLDTDTYYPLRVKTPTGLEIAFTDVRFNQDIDPATFVFVPPPGMEVRRIE
jgi:outer membrane lipoprotein-sorting protein